MQHLIRSSLVTLLLAAMPARGAGQDPVELRWRGKAGDALRYRMTQKQTIGMSMMPQPTESETAFVFRQEVKELSSEGVGSLELEYEAVRLEVGGPQSMSYDSTRKGEETKKNDPDLAEMLEPILGARIRMKIDPSNHVVEIAGLAEAMDEAFDSLKASDGGEAFKQLVNEENLRRMVEVTTFPEQALTE